MKKIMMVAVIAAALASCGGGSASADPLPVPVTSAWEASGYTLDRDCGFSAPVNGTDYWLFCDTAEFGPSGLTGFITGSTAAAGSYTPGQPPPVLTDLPSGVPSQFLPPPTNGEASPAGPGYIGNWPMGEARLPGTSKLVIPFGEYDVSQASLPFVGWGIAIWSPTKGVLYDKTLSRTVNFGGTPVFSNGYMYLTSADCTPPAGEMIYGMCASAAGDVYMSRVPVSQWQDTSAYRWDNQGNWGSIGSRYSVTSGGAVAAGVWRDPGHGFAMIVQPDIGGHYLVLNASYLTGLPGWARYGVMKQVPCSGAAGVNLCRAITLHPELSTSSQLAITWFDPGSGPHGHVMFEEVPWP